MVDSMQYSLVFFLVVKFIKQAGLQTVRFQGAFPVTELARFAIVGTLCFTTGFVSLYLLTDLAGLHYLVSMCISMLIVNLLGWLLNRLWTFKSRSIHVKAEIGRYFVVNLFGFGVTLAMMALLVSGLGAHYLVASVIVAILVMLVNYVAHRNWSFDKSRQHDEPRP